MAGIKEDLGSGGTFVPAPTGATGPSGVGFTPRPKSGAAIAPVAFAYSTAAPINGQAAAHPFVVPAAGVTIHGFVFEVSTLGSAGSLARVVLWADDGTNYPGAVLHDTPDASRIDCTTTGVKTYTPASDVVLASAAADYLVWAAVITQGAPTTVPTYRSLTGLCPLLTLPATGVISAASAYSKTGVTGAAPNWTGTTLAITISTPALRLVVA